MTIATTGNKISHDGNGVTKTFVFPYEFLARIDLVVLWLKAGETEPDVLEYGIDYSVAGENDPTGGSITTLDLQAIPSGDTLYIYRDTPQTQEVDYTFNDNFDSEANEDALDKLVINIQDLTEQVDRAVKSGITEEYTYDLPPADPLKVIGFSEDGSELVTYDVLNDATVGGYEANDILQRNSGNSLWEGSSVEEVYNQSVVYDTGVQGTLKVKNIDDWATYVALGAVAAVGDQIIYNGVNYKNLTGSQTYNAPDIDITNWTLVTMQIGTVPYVDFDTTAAPECVDGRIKWNSGEYTLDVCTGLGPVVQIGQEQLILIYNDTGSTITNGQVLHPVGGTMQGGIIVPKVELADASDYEKCQGTLLTATSQILDGNLGFGTTFGKVREVDTSGIATGSQVWLSPTTPGAITNVHPQFPDYSISVGGTLSSSPTEGILFANQTNSVEDTFHEAWDGAIRETFDFRTTSDGVNVTGALTNPHVTNDKLTLIYSTGFNFFDTVANGDITLTAGTVVAPQLNYVYIPISTKALTVSLTGFPEEEHCKVAKLFLQDATTTQTNGALRNQNINDHIKKDNNNGHILHIAERLRKLNSEWDNGALVTLTGTTSNVYINVTAGEVWQMHKQSFPAISMASGDGIHVANDPTTPYRTTTNLNDITEYSDGSNWNNDWSNIVVWGVANKTGEESHIMCNLPTDGYNSEDKAIKDRSNFTNYTIPKEFKGVGFLIGRFTIRRSGTVFTYNPGTGYLDLRGFVPNNTAGGGAGSSGITEFLGLTDTPGAYTGQAGKVATVNTAEDGLEFTEASGGQSYQPGFINGFIIENNLTFPEYRIDFKLGKCRSSSDSYDIKAVSEYSKDLDDTGAGWAAGDNVRGLADGLTVSPRGTYHLFVLWNPLLSSNDYGYDTDINAVNLLASLNVISGGFTQYRRVGSVITDSSSDIIPFTAIELSGGGINVLYTNSITDYNSTSTSTAQYKLSVPTGFKLEVSCFCVLQHSHSGGSDAYYWSGFKDSSSRSDYYMYSSDSNTEFNTLNIEGIVTDSNGKIWIRHSHAGSSPTKNTLKTNGYKDQRIN